jgi:hypothetical protein
MTALALFCLASVIFLVPRDLFLEHTRDVEVWFGFEVRGPWALLTAPLHWAVFLIGAWGFWSVRTWVVPAAAVYSFYVALCHLIWNQTSPSGWGWQAGLMQTLLFSLPGFVLLYTSHGGGRSLLANTPNLISAFRAACAPVLLVLAWNGATGAFLALFGVALLSDVVDGALARRFGLESDLGARLDQWADFAAWLAFPVGAWWLWPDLVRR